ncbi:MULTISPECIES: AAA family ATPase [Bacillus cereus group]|uniref:Uncharacterized protein n=1 Tax=Bacillus thuringiensis TaxID=1428 RepID=A0A1C4DFU2_BACTU|nr:MULTISPECIES: AAA family ATPase [Bacillus cereus group]MED3025270.1 AAA family ATPase [Bacillus wiedmannii]OTX98329.1 hypothetical protein BK729_13810 [Bacillus thuringiensis serovar wratislaviensis]OUB53483.1 hypothetical protein BK743_28780 [Bacillus thuringiensis serovar sylvestriensis]SCC30234.1 Protein of unknown function [Bacillus thuringiensis]
MKIYLEDFFDIKRAEIDLKPLMIICGDNGTGKTHLIKLLAKMNELLANGNLFEVNEKDLTEISTFLNIEELKGKILLRQPIDIEIKSESLQELYLFLEKVVNRNIKSRLDAIWKETFGKSYSPKNLKKMAVKFNNRASNLNVSINFKESESNPQLELLKNLSEVSNDIKNTESLKELFEKLALIDNANSLNLTFEITTETYVSRRGLSILGENSDTEKKVDRIICSTIENIFAHLYPVDLDIKGVSRELYYLPASREAYHRDLEHFREKFKKNDNYLITRYVADKKGRKTNNFNSKDPFIEKYVEDIMRVLTRDVEKDSLDEKTKLLLNFFEENVMKAKVLVNSGAIKFKLPNEDIITPSMASSLQNEYSFLKILIERSNKPNLIIEEPESHLSIKSAIKLAYFLLCYQYNNKNLLWLTTHNNFIGDAINNFIMISKLNEIEQKEFLNLLGLNNIIDNIDPFFENRIAAYLICNNEVTELPKNEYGINFENFNNQINNFINITTKLQVKMDNCME